MSKTTLKSIAKELGLSVASVSKALNDSHDIGKKTKSKVKAYAQHMGYSPNKLALWLKKGKTNILGIVVPQTVSHFYQSIIWGMQEELYKHNCNLMVWSSENSLEMEKTGVEILMTGIVDAVAICCSNESETTGNYEHIERVIKSDTPALIFDKDIESLECDKLLFQDKEGAYMATQKLIEKGCKRIALFFPQLTNNPSKNRFEGYKQALKESKIEVEENLLLEIPYEVNFKKVITDFLKQQQCDAIFCLNDIFAAETLKATYKLGIKVPDELFIMGFSNSNILKYVYPSVSTVSQRSTLTGQEIAKQLIERISEIKKEHKKPYTTKYIQPKIVLRESTGI